MADITMCNGKNCSKSATCYRHTATANEYRQSYFMTAPVVIKDGKEYCEHYWNNKERNK